MIDFLDVSFAKEDAFPVFVDLNVSIGRADRVFISGPMSLGRNEFISLLGGFDFPDKGVVSVFGDNVARLDVARIALMRKRIGFLLEESALLSNLKVIENVALPLMFHEELSDEQCMQKAEERLSEIGYKNDIWMQPATLSLLEKKLVLCARALITDPQIVVCSDIFDDLSASECGAIADFIASYQSERKDCSVVYLLDSGQDPAFTRPTRVMRFEGKKILEVF